MVTMCGALRQVKEDPFAVLNRTVIEEVCQELGYHWRAGTLDPAHTVALFVQQIIEGNISCAEVRHLSDRRFSGSAYCQARSRLPLEVVQELSRRVGAAVRRSTQEDQTCRYQGHRTWVVDGSTFSMPDTPELQEHFPQPQGPKPGCGFPAGHFLAMFDAQSGVMEEPAVGKLYTSDVKDIRTMHAKMQEGDILLGDDSFSSWGHFALVLRAKLHLIVPNHHKRIVDFRPGRDHVLPANHAAGKGRPRCGFLKALGPDDQLVQWFKPQACPAWMSQEDYDGLPESITVREIRRRVQRPGFRPIEVIIVTTLLDPVQYPAQELVGLRLSRWGVETNLRHLKTTMGLEVLKCKTVQGVLKELAVFVLVYNLVRSLMLEAADRQKVPVDRISFADALHWLGHAQPEEPLPDLLINPYRPNRIEPRARKRRPKPYPWLSRPREEWRKVLSNQRERA